MKLRKWSIILVTIIMIGTGFYTAASVNNQHVDIIEISRSFSSPTITYEDNKYIINLKGTNNYLDGIPFFSETFEYPLGTKIKSIRCSYNPFVETVLPNKIIANKNPIPPSYNKPNWRENTSVEYSIYNIKKFAGINRNGEETLFLTVELYPIQYSNSILRTTNYISLNIEVEEPVSPMSFPDKYDLLIVSYDDFTDLLAPLVNHKNSIGIKTKLVSLSDIYNGIYFPVQGRDGAEKIKYFIKNAREEWGIKYVLLVGNYWRIPVRYSHLETDKGTPFEELSFVSDLYYADIYDANGNFSSWDTDNDGIYGEWPYMMNMEDNIDMAPDIYVGRLACTSRFEVETMVDKIITYENTTYNSKWFNRMVVVGGDTFDKNWENGTDYNEGEIATEKAIEYMDGFTPVRIWASLGNLTTENIIDEISKGCGFTYFCGHGNPRSWGTHNNGDYHNWTEGLYNRDMLRFSNKDMYPILMVGGCHNSEIDVTPINFIKGLLKEGLHYFSTDPEDFGSYWFYNWVPECWSWYFVKVRNGGAIASMGSTGYGGVNIGDNDRDGTPDCIEGADGWFETLFFKLYNRDRVDILGETYGQTILDYINNFPVYKDRYDAKIIQTHILLGDPSLKIGGYPIE